MKNITLLALAALAFTSCKEEIKIDYTINNQMQEDIIVTGRDHYSNESFDFTVSPGNEVIIKSFEERKKDVDYIDPKDMFGDALFIINAAGDTMPSEYYKESSNWSGVKTGDGRDYKANYILDVRSGQF